MDAEREEALRWVRRKRTFYLILGIWLALSVMWFLIDLLSDSTLDWFYWPMMDTGIFVAISGIVLLGMGNLFGPDWGAAPGRPLHGTAAAPRRRIRHRGLSFRPAWRLSARS